jgi:flap endonuclease-1
MGVPLTPIVVKQSIDFEALRGRRVAVDGNGELYQFLALIRLPGGTPLKDSSGRITSHLSGLFYRTTRFIADYGMSFVFVFDGAPPALKRAELERRRGVRERYEVERDEALAAGDLARAYSKATMTSRLTREMVGEAQTLLGLLGIPCVQAPSEGEAQAAHMAARGIVWASVSKDYDSLLFGTPRLVRFLTVSGKEFLPSKGLFRPITPECIALADMLTALGITREQLVDLALLVGTDFSPGVKGIGPKKALRLVRQYGSIDAMPDDLRAPIAGVLDEARHIYLHPEVVADPPLAAGPPDRDGVIRFLCEERAFGRERVEAALSRAFGG